MHDFFNSGWSTLLVGLLAVLILWQGFWAATRGACSRIKARRRHSNTARSPYSTEPLSAMQG